MTEQDTHTSLGKGHALVLFASAQSAPEVVSSLARAGIKVSLVKRQGTRPVVQNRKAIEGVHEVVPPERDVAESLKALQDVILRVSPDVILPIDDSALWLVANTQGAAREIPAVPDAARTAIALDKRLQVQHASASGFHVPPTVMLNSPSDLAQLEHFPAALRPALAARELGNRLGRGSIRICEDRDSALRIRETWTDEDPLLAQPFIRGVGEGVFGCSHRGQVHAMSAHRRVRMLNPAGSGASACEPRPLDDETVECVRTMASRMNWSGMFMVELLRDGEGTPWFVEWNGRAWGSLALSRRRGLEYPAWTIEAALGREPGFVEPDERGSFLCRNLGRELLHLLHVLRGPRGDDLHEWPSRLGTLRDLLRFKRTDRWYNLEDGDWWFFLRESAHNVRTHLRKARWS